MTNAIRVQKRAGRTTDGDWSVDQTSRGWTLTWFWERQGRVVHITDSNAPEGIAIDAACEYMDRWKDGNHPRFETREDLMQWCVRRAWRQR